MEHSWPQLTAVTVACTLVTSQTHLSLALELEHIGVGITGEVIPVITVITGEG